MSGLVLAILVAVVGVSACVAWFGVLRTRKAETEFGIQALANLKWRDCLGVVLEALHRDGYQRSAVAETPAGGATEVMLTRNGDDVLLDYKHGTAYHLTESNVREFVNDVSLNGAREGILVTLGSAEPGALRVAATHNVHLIGGQELWPKVRNFVLPSILDGVRKQASAQTRNGLYIGSLVSVVAAGIVYYLVGDSGPTLPMVADSEVAPLVGGAPAVSSDAAMLAQINATAKAFEAAAKLKPAERAQRRAEAARRVSALPRVAQAAWSAQSTLLVTLRNTADEKQDDQLLGEICRLLVQQEEMRFSRIQLESAPDSGQRVRWRSCE